MDSIDQSDKITKQEFKTKVSSECTVSNSGTRTFYKFVLLYKYLGQQLWFSYSPQKGE